ncbi:uncharacterized protein PG986_015039 [Apiospora aurea]|uniref:Uncharacterized protein n=1 Tax=Apiospora aurea TaxID=335848 RepID=A0ABR1PRF2_9PEZI
MTFLTVTTRDFLTPTANGGSSNRGDIRDRGRVGNGRDIELSRGPDHGGGDGHQRRLRDGGGGEDRRHDLDGHGRGHGGGGRRHGGGDGRHAGAEAGRGVLVRHAAGGRRVVRDDGGDGGRDGHALPEARRVLGVGDGGAARGRRRGYRRGGDGG